MKTILIRSLHIAGRVLSWTVNALAVVLAFVCLVAWGAVSLLGIAIYSGWKVSRPR